MPFPPVPQRWLPALAITALFHVLIVFVLLHAITIEPVPPAKSFAQETQITLLPVLAPPPDRKRTRRRAAGGSNAITPYFNPYAVPQFAPPRGQMFALQTALTACAPEHYDMASDEIRDVCGRIGALLKNDRGHFGVTQDVADPTHWQHELIKRNSPLLAPCMSANLNVLYTLKCIYENLFIEWDPGKHTTYQE